jgi:hypothetical protein
LKEISKSPPVLRQIEYDFGKPVIVTIEISSIAIGWVVDQDDVDGRWFAVRFGAKILTKQQRAYLQIKRELLGVFTTLKTERNYLIGANVVLETDCLLLLGIIANCSIPNIAMLRWIAYIKLLNLVLVILLAKRILWLICCQELGISVKKKWKHRRLKKIMKIMIMTMFWQPVEQIQMVRLYLTSRSV